MFNFKTATTISSNYRFNRWEINADTSSFSLKNTFAEEGEGPVLEVVRTRDAVAALKPVRNADQTKRVCETVSETRAGLAADKALIGFCGAPWTVASYMIAGGSSDRVLAKVAAYRREDWFGHLIEKLAVESVEYLSAQIEAGAEAVQIFDSWAGDLQGAERQLYVEKPIASICSALRKRHPDVPVIAFARGVGSDHGKIARLDGVAAVGVETEFALEDLPPDVVVQGNLDPVALLAGAEVARQEARRICRSISRGRHIFNLGHGIRVGTDPEVVAAVVEEIRHTDG